MHAHVGSAEPIIGAVRVVICQVATNVRTDGLSRCGRQGGANAQRLVAFVCPFAWSMLPTDVRASNAAALVDKAPLP